MILRTPYTIRRPTATMYSTPAAVTTSSTCPVYTVVAPHREPPLHLLLGSHEPDQRRHDLLGDPGVHEQVLPARPPLVEGRVDEERLRPIGDRRPGVASRACLHGDDRVGLVLTDRRVERLHGASRPALVVERHDLQRPPEDAAPGVDLLLRQLG